MRDVADAFRSSLREKKNKYFKCGDNTGSKEVKPKFLGFKRSEEERHGQDGQTHVNHQNRCLLEGNLFRKFERGYEQRSKERYNG